MFKQTLRAHHMRGLVPTFMVLLPLAGIVTACSGDDAYVPTAIAPSSANFGKNVTGSNQRILFSSDRDGNREIYSINPDGTDETRLTNDPGSDREAVWSPDGKRIAFVGTRDNLFGEIYTMNADGTNVVRLTNTPGASASPSWSKNGSQLVFSSNRDLFDPATATVNISQFEVYVMNADGSGVVRLTNNDQFDGSPVFSPDGRQIAFTSQRDHPGTSRLDLYLMDSDGANVTRLTSQNATVSTPSWDPHGRNLAFSISGSATESGIFTLDPNNLGLTRLTFGTSGVDDAPSYSADGSQLVFASLRESTNSQLFVMNADGSNAKRITTNNFREILPRWSR